MAFKLPINENTQYNSDDKTAETLFIISPERRSGLILCHDYYAEFLGPGAAIVPYEQCHELVFIDSPVLIPASDRKAHDRAYRIRLSWIRWLQKITRSSPCPFYRTQNLLWSLEVFFGVETIKELTDEVLARLIGVFPATVRQVRQCRQWHWPSRSKVVSYWEPVHFDRAFEVHRLKYLQSNLTSPSSVRAI
ncbi:hypothetical protein [Roseofilum casamattae]|uniref:Uncharacterized protein n=1 Tax=Roseofilum casamattae BLCC-M143 TaxID=3022442 RepID=A0ABT7BTD7_9CYAN|nr:hypothetical protein [Roseofilum casamattae]MDJ1182444.1 hypothetical protein [Roseofilum casamattae BLCC-M143]